MAARVSIHHDETNDGIACITIEGRASNAMSPALLQEIEGALDAHGGSRALILGARGKAFSAGLDLPLLLSLSRDETHGFITAFSRVMRRLFSWPAPVLAAVNGHAVAGGFVLACTADFRLVSDPSAKLGMTGVPLGIAYPRIVASILQYALPQSFWHSVLLEGRLCTAEEALGLALFERLVEPETLDEWTLERARRLLDGDALAYARTKAMLKASALSLSADEEAASHDAFVHALFAPASRSRLEAAALRLKEKSLEIRGPHPTSAQPRSVSADNKGKW
jgi:enoyl-CoA hydratase